MIELERVYKSQKRDLDALINDSVSKTLSRTVLTSSTTQLAVLTMLFIWWGDYICVFIYTICWNYYRTYSSIFVVSPFIKFLGFKYR